jgi:bifunctional enzyme CysN/CysC
MRLSQGPKFSHLNQMTSKRRQVAWFTGLSGAGKSTIAELAAGLLRGKGKMVLVLDGDSVREKLHQHLGFTPEDIRLITDLCQESLVDYDVILVPIISPFRESRRRARAILGDAFREVFVQVSLDEAARRDTKGLYRQAREGSLKNLIGVDSEVPYELPENPDILLNTETSSAEVCGQHLAEFLLA